MFSEGKKRKEAGIDMMMSANAAGKTVAKIWGSEGRDRLLLRLSEMTDSSLNAFRSSEHLFQSYFNCLMLQKMDTSQVASQHLS